MKVNIAEQETIISFSVEGYLDTTTAPKFEAELTPYLAGEKSFVFDFSGLEYISSAGLRVILRTLNILEERDRSLTVRNIKGEVREVFEMTGFDSLLALE